MDKRIGKSTKRVRTISNSDHSLDKMFDIFYHAKASEGKARNTLDSYRTNYTFLVEFMDSRGLGRDVRNVTVKLIRDYIVWMLNEKIRFDGHQYVPESEKTVGLAPSSVNTRLKTIRTMFTFLKENGYVEENVMDGIKNVSEPQNEIEILSEDQMLRLLNAPNRRTFAGFRNHVLMTFLIDSFMRISEALNTKKSDIDYETCVVVVRGEVAKNRKSRVIPLQKHTLKLLKELEKENEDFDSEYIFLTNYGERLDPNPFRNDLKEYAEMCGINKTVHPHLFRHTAATLYLENGGDIRHLQMLMGHSDLRMVMRYTHLSKKSLINQHEKYSPLNRVLGKLNRERKTMRKR